MSVKKIEARFMTFMEGEQTRLNMAKDRVVSTVTNDLKAMPSKSQLVIRQESFASDSWTPTRTVVYDALTASLTVIGDVLVDDLYPIKKLE